MRPHNEPLGRLDVSTWQQGATAAREGKPSHTNPYPYGSPWTRHGIDHQTWFNGWKWAKARMEAEDRKTHSNA